MTALLPSRLDLDHWTVTITLITVVAIALGACVVAVDQIVDQVQRRRRR